MRGVDYKAGDGAVCADVVVVEADGCDPAKDSAVVSLLADKGYVYHGHEERNNWFVRSGFQATSLA